MWTRYDIVPEARRWVTGEAAQRALELDDAGFTASQIARTLRAWWGEFTPLSGDSWDEHTASLFIRSSRHFHDAYDGDTDDCEYTLGLADYAAEYRRRLSERHGCTDPVELCRRLAS